MKALSELSDLSAEITSVMLHTGRRRCGGWISETSDDEGRGPAYYCEECDRTVPESETITVYPCARCGWKNECGDPPGEDCHS